MNGDRGRQDGHAIEVLLVEDNPGDVRLATKHLQREKVINKVHVTRDGEEALQFLRREGAFADAIRPDLVLLDLNLPKLSGIEVLHEVKNDPDLVSIPVVVLTSSDAEEDVAKSYAAHANAYVRKPVSLAEFSRVVRVIDEFWFSIVRLPR